VATLREKFAYPADHVIVLGEAAADGVQQATRENVRSALAALTARAGTDDLLLVLLLGHGTAGDGDAKFNLVGPDLSASEWAALLEPLKGRLVFVNASSGSFDFLERLSGRGRVVLTATDSAAQEFETVFPEFFIEAFDENAADLDKNGRVSIWEAFRRASDGVKDWFEQQGRLATERPLLDDNGDGVGREAETAGPDGSIAQATYLQPDVQIPAAAGGALADLLKRRAEIASAIDALRARKNDVAAERYDAELETLLLELARVDADIRTKSGDSPRLP
jgi:hypothetical protein